MRMARLITIGGLVGVGVWWALAPHEVQRLVPEASLDGRSPWADEERNAVLCTAIGVAIAVAAAFLVQSRRAQEAGARRVSAVRWLGGMLPTRMHLGLAVLVVVLVLGMVGTFWPASWVEASRFTDKVVARFSPTTLAVAITLVLLGWLALAEAGIPRLVTGAVADVQRMRRESDQEE